MYYSFIYFAVFTAGISGITGSKENSSEKENFFDEFNNFVHDLSCNVLNEFVLGWRETASTITNAKVDYYQYYNSDEYDDSEDASDDSDYNFSWSGDESDFDPTINRTTVIIHGYLGSYKNKWMQSLKDALLNWRKNNMSVLLVNWSKSFNYHTAAGAVDEVAEEIYEKLMEFAIAYDEKSIARPYLHIMGHSLGAHIAGLTAKKLNTQFGWFVNRVTGFDPAKPFFDIEDDFEEYRLDKSHARFVDVIHTNSAPNTSTFGLYDALGHIDFYPNGGDNQPTCAEDRGKTWKSMKSSTACPESDVKECLAELGNDVSCIVSSFVIEKENMICDHAKGQEYFEDSLRGKFKHSAVRFHNVTNYSNINCNDKCCKNGQISMGMYASNCGNNTHNGQYYVKVI